MDLNYLIFSCSVNLGDDEVTTEESHHYDKALEELGNNEKKNKKILDEIMKSPSYKRTFVEDLSEEPTTKKPKDISIEDNPLFH